MCSSPSAVTARSTALGRFPGSAPGNDSCIQGTLPWCHFKHFSETFTHVMKFRSFTMEMQACSERKKRLRERMMHVRGREVEGVLCGEQKDLGIGLSQWPETGQTRVQPSSPVGWADQTTKSPSPKSADVLGSSHEWGALRCLTPFCCSSYKYQIKFWSGLGHWCHYVSH